MRPALTRVAFLFLEASVPLLLVIASPSVALSYPVAIWSRVTNPPPARSNAGMAYDSRRQRILVFGGCKQFGCISDLWSLSLIPPREWTELAPWWEGPPYEACYPRGAVYDSLRDDLLIVQPGVYYGGPGDTLAIYAYSFGGTSGWHRLETTGAGPPKPESWPILVLDPGEHRLIMISEQVWALALHGPLSWTRLFPTGNGPSLAGVAAALDAPHRRVLVNGGGAFGAPFAKATWALDLSGSMHWDSLAVAPLPTGRRDHMAIYDPLRNWLVVAGGYSGSELLDAWALDLDAGTWSEVASPVASIGKRYAASAVFDPLGDAMVIFGGLDWSSFLVETVRLSFWSPEWEVDPPTAEPVHNATMVYDDQRRRMLLFGGLGSLEQARDRLYALDMTAAPPRWERIVVSGPQPVRRYSHMSAWDPVRHRMFVFGGQVDATLLSDLWFYSEDSSPQWTQVTTTGTPPSARAAGALAYDPPRDRLVLMGGRSDILDVWELPLSGPTAFQWRMLAPAGTTPAVRRSMGLMHDPLRDRLLIVAGVDAGGNSQPTFALELNAGGDGAWSTVLGRLIGMYPAVTILRKDTVVVYDHYSATSPQETKQLALASPTAWTSVEVAGLTPPRRIDHCGAYDLHLDRLAIFGGQIMKYSDSERRWFADTWVLSWIDPSQLSVDPGTISRRPFLGLPTPNPARDGVTVALSRPRGGPGALEVLDIHGRRVLEWPLDDAITESIEVLHFARRLEPGVYLLRLVGRSDCVTRKFCILR